MKPEIRQGLERAARVISDAKTMVVTGHVGPDGDSLGSSLALAFDSPRVPIFPVPEISQTA